MLIGLITYRKKIIIVILALVIMNLVIYWQVRNFNFINYDDNLYVTQNPKIQSGVTCQSVMYAFTDIHTGNWHPLTMFSHTLDWQLFGEKAGGHHWTNLIIHIFNTILLFLLLNTMTGSIWRSAMVASLFAIHPINVESVAWVAERKNLLSTFFCFLTMLFYVWYVLKPGWKRYLPVFLCFALGLMSKSMLVTLPFVLLLIDYWPLNRTVIGAQKDHQAALLPSFRGGAGKVKLSFLIWEKIPLFVLTAVIIGVTLYTQKMVGAMMTVDSLPLANRISNAILSYGLYIKKMLWPLDLSVFYPRYNVEIWKILIVSSSLIILSIEMFRYYRKYPYLPVGWLWFLGTLMPVIGLVQVGAQSMADRYAYVPYIGLFILLVWFVSDIAKRNKYRRIFVAFTSLLLIIALTAVSWQRCQLWGDQFALWDDVLKKHKVAFAYNFRGLAYAAQGLHHMALKDYDNAIAMDKKFSEAFNNRAIAYNITGERTKALNDYHKAVNLNPKFADAYYNRGLLQLEMNHLDMAIADFTTAIGINPDMADYFNYRGVAFRSKGEYEKSFADFNQALKRNPNFAEAYFNRGLIYHIHKQHIPAIVNFSEALKIKPAYVDARFSRGLSFASLGKFDQAVKDFNNVLKVDSKYIPALENLGIALKKLKRYEESSAQFKKVLLIKPDDREVLNYIEEIENIKQKN